MSGERRLNGRTIRSRAEERPAVRPGHRKVRPRSHPRLWAVAQDSQMPLLFGKLTEAPNKWQFLSPCAPRQYGSGSRVVIADPQDKRNPMPSGCSPSLCDLRSCLPSALFTLREAQPAEDGATSFSSCRPMNRQRMLPVKFCLSRRCVLRVS